MTETLDKASPPGTRSLQLTSPRTSDPCLNLPKHTRRSEHKYLSQLHSGISDAFVRRVSIREFAAIYVFQDYQLSIPQENDRLKRTLKADSSANGSDAS